MNILFLNNAEVAPTTNGIQRITHVLANGFTDLKSARCFSAYFSENKVCPKTEFAGKIRLNKLKLCEELGQFVQEHEIDVVVCQQVVGGRALFEQVRKACLQRKGCRLIYCLHACPTYVFVRPNLRAEWFRLLHGDNKMHSLKKLLVGLLPIPLYNYWVGKKTQKEYSIYNECFDGIVLLSENYIDEYCALSGAPGGLREKVWAIPNAFSFESKIDLRDMEEKQHEVLVVSRLSDRQKRVSDTLKVWKCVEREKNLSDWILRIVGTGEDEAYYKALTRKLGLKRVSFEGRQDPVGYYRRASIYVMTSAYEGFPMTLVEAAQMGCVRVVSDTYRAVRDVIEDGRTGILIPKDEVCQFADTLSLLMSDAEKRTSLTHAGLADIDKFSVENITEQWFELFDHLKVKQ